MRDLLVSMAVGGAVGIVFAVLRLPVPAPSTLAGVAGILGLFLGYKLVQWLI
ncbi:MAG TPA: XapX domain-containing protein [Firmicutes bacterium]|nr:XapX domain-containing protein [Bacillota bacterium]